MVAGKPPAGSLSGGMTAGSADAGSCRRGQRSRLRRPRGPRLRHGQPKTSNVAANPKTAARPSSAMEIEEPVGCQPARCGAERRADAHRQADRAVDRQIEIADPARHVGGDQRHHDAEHRGTDAIQRLHRGQRHTACTEAGRPAAGRAPAAPRSPPARCRPPARSLSRAADQAPIFAATICGTTIAADITSPVLPPRSAKAFSASGNIAALLIWNSTVAAAKMCRLCRR